MRRLLCKVPTLILCLIILCVQTRFSVATDRELQSSLIAGNTMGTYFRITVIGVDSPALESDLKDRILGILYDTDQIMSTYNEASTVSLFNKYQGRDWYSVPASLVEVVESALDISRVSGGGFDITVGRLVNLWGFGTTERVRGTQSFKDISRAKKIVGYRYLRTQNNPPALKKEFPALSIDLSAIAKGYAIDQISHYLDSEGVKNYLIDIGGDMRMSGVNSESRPWTIAIESPGSGSDDFQKILSVTNAAIATSGSYRNYFNQDGVRYSHIIDPRTGKPVRHSLVSVTVVAKSAAQADALATAVMVLGPEAGLKMLKQENLQALLVVKTDDGFTQITTDNFEALSYAS